jgi:hypothetical protein
MFLRLRFPGINFGAAEDKLDAQNNPTELPRMARTVAGQVIRINSAKILGPGKVDHAQISHPLFQSHHSQSLHPLEFNQPFCNQAAKLADSTTY